jgi:hypothetical protein
MGASSKYSLNLLASIVALEISSRSSGLNLAMSYRAISTTQKTVERAATDLDQSEQEIRRERAFVSLVDDESRVAGQVRLRQELSQKHAVGHVLEHGLVARAVLEPDGVADLGADAAPYLLRDARGDGHGGDAPGLGAADLHAVLGVAGLVQVLGQLRRLARTCFGDNNENLVLLDGSENVVTELKDRQRLAGLVDRLRWKRAWASVSAGG